MRGVLAHRSFALAQWPAVRRKGGRAGALAIALTTCAIAGTPATAQNAPMNPIQAFFSSVFGAAPPPRMSAPEQNYEPRRREHRSSSHKIGWATGGGVLVCVRSCDGAFFPASTSGVSRWDRAEEVCSLLCPNAATAVYTLPFGGTIEEAVSLTGERYRELPNAGKFEQSRGSDCSCRRSGQSWADALRAAEARYGHRSHDIFVTREASDRMARPVADPKAKVAAPSFMTTDSAAHDPQAAQGLDVNGVDTGLKAATAALSKATSGIQDDEDQRPVHMGLKQGRLVEDVGPDGSNRKVRVLTPSE